MCCDVATIFCIVFDMLNRKLEETGDFTFFCNNYTLMVENVMGTKCRESRDLKRVIMVLKVAGEYREKKQF